MPIIKSAVKRVRQADASRARNVATKRLLRDSVKSLEAAIESKNTKKTPALLNKVYSSYDTAVKKNLVHKNKAARQKVRFSAAVKSLGAKPVAKKTTAKKKPAASKTTKATKK